MRISIPENARPQDEFVLFTVPSRDLRHLKIERGDTLLCRRNFTEPELTDEKICIITDGDGLYCKQVKEIDFRYYEVKALAVEHKRAI